MKKGLYRMPPKTHEPTELETVMAAQKIEDAAWNELEINLDQMQIAMRELFAMTIKVESALNLMIDKGMLTAEEVQLAFHKLHVDRMQTIRASIEPQIRRAKMGLAPQPTVLGPDGQPMKI